jgi:hypothetical protein
MCYGAANEGSEGKCVIYFWINTRRGLHTILQLGH